MDHHSSVTKRFLLEPISPFIFPNPSVVIFVHQQAPHQQIHVVHHVHKIELVPKIVCPCAPTTLAQATSSECCWTEHATASLARCLARLPPRRTPPSCQLPAIPHVGKVGVGVSRPQRTTAMPTSHAATATVTAQL
ncbi:hypothetical protein ACLOJK_006898, partial [Asimina triloba]